MSITGAIEGYLSIDNENSLTEPTFFIRFEEGKKNTIEAAVSKMESLENADNQIDLAALDGNYYEISLSSTSATETLLIYNVKILELYYNEIKKFSMLKTKVKFGFIFPNESQIILNGLFVICI